MNIKEFTIWLEGYLRVDLDEEERIEIEDKVRCIDEEKTDCHFNGAHNIFTYKGQDPKVVPNDVKESPTFEMPRESYEKLLKDLDIDLEAENRKIKEELVGVERGWFYVDLDNEFTCSQDNLDYVHYLNGVGEKLGGSAFDLNKEIK